MNTLAAKLIGTEFTHIVQPYGPYTIKVEKAEVFAQELGYHYAPMGPHIWFRLYGTVVEGSETGFLWGATSTRSIVGQRREVNGISTYDMAKGSKITVAM